MTTIIGMTWKEMLRKKVMLLTFLMTAVFLIGFWYVARTIGTSVRHASSGGFPGGTEQLIQQYASGVIILTLGFFFAAFVIAFLAIFSSFSVVSGEAEQGVLQALLPRPIPRWKWFLGRWLGYVSLGIGYGLLLFAAILVIADIHAAVPHDALSLIKSFLLFISVIPLLTSVTMLGSVYFTALGNGVFMTMLFGAGWLGGMIEKLTGPMPLEESVTRTLTNISGIISLLMPADALQRRMLSELLGLKELQGVIGLDDAIDVFALGAQTPSNLFILYSVFYTLAALALGILRFQRKDL